MNELPFIAESQKFCQHLNEIKLERVSQKKKIARKYNLTKADKILILEKTNYKCHICGGSVTLGNFEADHVEAHSSSVNNKIDNFLPACRTCNNYRWFYSASEIKWILKLGVWLKTQIQTNTAVGKLACEKFILNEVKREARRKPQTNPAHFKNTQ
jgi:HNH endonuclease